MVWDHSARRIGAMLAGDAIELPDKLRTSEEWKTQGIAVVERYENRLMLDERPRPKRSRKKKGVEPEPEQPPEEPGSKPKFYEKEHLRLTGSAGTTGAPTNVGHQYCQRSGSLGVPFSCKTRLCPSCGKLRANEWVRYIV